jgi:hypothetical protein
MRQKASACLSLQIAAHVAAVPELRIMIGGEAAAQVTTRTQIDNCRVPLCFVFAGACVGSRHRGHAGRLRSRGLQRREISGISFAVRDVIWLPYAAALKSAFTTFMNRDAATVSEQTRTLQVWFSHYRQIMTWSNLLLRSADQAGSDA